MTRKWNLIVDLDLCVNCHNCALATKDEHIGNDFPGYSAAQTSPGADTIVIEKHTRGSGTQVELTYVPRMCQHCDNAPCMRSDTRGAIHKRGDGIVILDPVLAKGAADMPSLCPFGMIKWDETAQVPHIWNFDAHLLDTGWQAPRGVQACPTSAIDAVRLEDREMAAKAESEALQAFPGTEAAKPRVYYRNAHRLTRHLVTGTVLVEMQGRIECAKGIAVTLREDEIERATATTDAFGEFAFERVSSDCERIEILLSGPDGTVRTVPLEGGRSHVVEIEL